MFDQMMLHYPQTRPMENRWKPAIEIAPNCPRCASPNTKFCYYNNYSLSQPRYFCKGCRRYWTKGGSLRNVPVGGGCRKNRRSRPARSSHTTNGSFSYLNNSSSSGGDSANESPERANIDLADVFAKFLNQNSENQEFVGESSSSGTDLQLSEEAEFQNMVIHPFTAEEESFMVQNTNLLEIQDILNEELPEDMCWNDETTTLSSFAWQQAVYEPFVCNNDDLNMMRVTEDWSSTALDVSSVGNFF